MTACRALPVLLAAAALVLAMPAAAQRSAPSQPVAGSFRPVQDVSFPFWCDWGYDWDERCYRDDSDRLSIGGDTDKVWRSGVRFSLSAIPPGSQILEASLSLYHDGTCVAPRKTSRTCAPRRYTIDLHQILSADWFDEREVDHGPALARAVLVSAARSEWLTWDVTDLAAAWVSGDAQNDGLLLKLADGEEDFDVSGPLVPSSTFADPSRRPALDVAYLPPR